MPINLATKFAPVTSDLLKARRKTKAMTNQDWDWDGVGAINVYTLSDPVMGNYNPTGSGNRYGNPTEVEDTIQTFTLVRDRSWSKVMDKKNKQDTLAIRQPGKYLAQATKNVLVPEMDTYILQTIATAGNTASRDAITAKSATTSGNAFSNFTTINAQITDDESPTEGRVCGMTANYYNLLKQGGFVLNSDAAYADRKSGDLGSVDGCPVMIIPSNRMPSTSGAIDLVITHPSATVAPEKLEDYTLHNNPPGFSGDLLEYRHRYDCFVDVNRVKTIGLHAVA